MPARVWREAFDGFLKTPDFTSELTKVSVPVLLVWGDRDTYALRAAQDRLLEVMPKARKALDMPFTGRIRSSSPRTSCHS